MFVGVEDFKEIPYKIPNEAELRGLSTFIESEEAKVLKKILGLQLYNDFIDGLETSGTIEQKWIDLRDGAEYAYGGKLYEYLGVADFLKPYIYSKWFEIVYRKPTGAGVVINQGQENTETQNPQYEVVTYWNEMVTKVGSCFKQDNTLYGFLKANESDYETLEFTSQKYRNTLDL